MRSSVLEILLSNERRRLQELKTENETIGDGKLHLIREGTNCYFREYSKHKQRGITKDKQRVYQLARKEIINEQIYTCEKTVAELEKICKVVSKLDEKTHTDKCLAKYGMLDRNKLLYSPKEQEWIKCRISQNPYKRENLVYETTNGVNVRSKSERYIAGFLEANNLVYMYEPPINIEGKIVYPDFMILRPDGKTVIWEHLGLMDNIEYFNKSMMKIQDYRKIGYIPSINIICTYEEDLHNINRLNEIINRYVFF